MKKNNPNKKVGEVTLKEYYGTRSRADSAAGKAFAYNRGESFDHKKHGDWYTQKEFIPYPVEDTKKHHKYVNDRVKEVDADTDKRSAEGRKKLVAKYEAESRQLALQRRKAKRAK
jgi:hypothetical protein